KGGQIYSPQCFRARQEHLPILRRGFRSQRTEFGPCCAARSGRNNDMGKRGLLVRCLQYAQGQPAPARSAHESDSQTEAAEVAAICADHFLCAAARSLEALRRSRVLERGAERLASLKSRAKTVAQGPRCNGITLARRAALFLR